MICTTMYNLLQNRVLYTLLHRVLCTIRYQWACRFSIIFAIWKMLLKDEDTVKMQYKNFPKNALLHEGLHRIEADSQNSPLPH